MCHVSFLQGILFCSGVLFLAGYLIYFKFLAIENSAASNIRMKIPPRDTVFISSACMPRIEIVESSSIFFFFVEGLSAFQDFFYNSSNSVQEFQFCHIFLTLTFFVNIPLILKNICWVRCFSKFSLLAQITHSSESGV